jgi:endo-1,4-beta-xylanase
MNKVMQHFSASSLLSSGQRVIVSWDVLNEAIDITEKDYPTYDYYNETEKSYPNLRYSSLSQLFGPEYIYLVFLYARQAADSVDDTGLKLYYNDYNLNYTAKASTVANMIKAVNDRYASEVPLDTRKLITGVGMQGHYNSSDNVIRGSGGSVDLAACLEYFAAIGVEITLTEMDLLSITYYEWYALNKGVWDDDDASGEFPHTKGQTVSDSHKTALEAKAKSPEAMLTQAATYAKLFQTFKNFGNSHPGLLSRISFWGFRDDKSWRTEAYPMLFETVNNQIVAKPAYYAVIDPENFLADHPYKKP